MAKGGWRPGAGRPKGAKNKRTLEMQQLMEARARELEDTLPNCFDGDAHAVLQSLYLDLNQPVNVRLEAAKAAAPFEKPRLMAEHITAEGGKSREEWEAELAREPVVQVYLPSNGREPVKSNRAEIEARETDATDGAGVLQSQNIDGTYQATSTSYDNPAPPLEDDGNSVETMSDRISKFRSIAGR